MKDKKQSKMEKVLVSLDAISDVTLFDDMSKVEFGDLEKKLAEVNYNHARATKLANKALLLKQRYSTQYQTLLSTFNINKTDLILSEEVKKGKNGTEREAIADNKLKADRIELDKAKRKLAEAENLCEVVNNTLGDIKLRKQGLNSQVRLYQQQKELEL